MSIYLQNYPHAFVSALARNISTKVEVLSHDVQYLAQIVNSSRDSVSTHNDDLLLQNLPLTSQEQMKEFEAGLNDEIKFAEVVSIFRNNL